MSVRPAKTQISLGIRPVWSESSLCAQWVAKDPSFLHADSEDSDQIGLIWVFAGCTAILLVLSWCCSNQVRFCFISSLYLWKFVWTYFMYLLTIYSNECPFQLIGKCSCNENEFPFKLICNQTLQLISNPPPTQNLSTGFPSSLEVILQVFSKFRPFHRISFLTWGYTASLFQVQTFLQDCLLHLWLYCRSFLSSDLSTGFPSSLEVILQVFSKFRPFYRISFLTWGYTAGLFQVQGFFLII